MSERASLTDVLREEASEQAAIGRVEETATERFESAFELAPTGVALIGMDGRFLRVNRALCQMLGRAAHEVIGSTSAPFTHPDDLSTTKNAFADLRDAGATVAVEKRYLRPDGEVVWASTRGQTVRGADDEAQYIVSHFLDVTASKLAEQRHREVSTLFETAFAEAPIGMALVAPDGRLLKVNRALCELTGYTESQLLRLTLQGVTHPDDIDADLEHVKRLLSGELERYTSERRYFTASAQEVWVNQSVSVVRDQHGQALHLVAHVEHISERKELQASLRRLADHDPLTGLWNRRRFEEELQREAARCKRYAERAAVLMIDLDEFKNVNDTHGHQAGDDLLKLIAGQIRATLRETDSVARIGGDEFAAILPNIAPDTVQPVADKLRQAILASCITVNDTTIGVGASIGSQTLDENSADPRVAMAEADAAMYQIKATRRR